MRALLIVGALALSACAESPRRRSRTQVLTVVTQYGDTIVRRPGGRCYVFNDGRYAMLDGVKFAVAGSVAWCEDAP